MILIFIAGLHILAAFHSQDRFDTKFILSANLVKSAFEHVYVVDKHEFPLLCHLAIKLL